MEWNDTEGIVMLKEWKSKRQLSLFVALALSAGGGALFSDFQHALASELTVDTGTTAYHGAYYGGVSSASNSSTHNKLTIKGSAMANAYFFGGWAQGNGDATDNEVELQDTAHV